MADNPNLAHLSSIDKAYLAIDFRNKTVFLDKKLDDITDFLLTYQEAEVIVDLALNEELP